MGNLSDTIRKILAGAALGLALIATLSLSSCEKQPVACSMIAKLCPDGINYVSRTGPNCEFAACPTQNQTYCTADVALCADGVTYVGRVPPDCKFAACPTTSAPAPTQPVGCTMEVLTCPDGSFVGRKAPYCLFEACAAPADKCNITAKGTGAYMPNPASVYCVNIGGESIIRTADDGSQYGVCKWKGIEMDEWELFRKNCP